MPSRESLFSLNHHALPLRSDLGPINDETLSTFVVFVYFDDASFRLSHNNASWSWVYLVQLYMTIFQRMVVQRVFDFDPVMTAR